MRVSVNTVNNYKVILYNRLEVHRKTQLVAKALQSGLISLQM